MQSSPCRLHVVVARDAPCAIVLRRGPTRWYHVIRWHMNRDVFEPGAWFRGRIYEERCDLSPDGKLLVYFCLRGSGAPHPGYTHAWTAVSRAPWLYALTLWPWGTTYGGGGRFTGNRELTLHIEMPIDTHPDHPIHGLNVKYTGSQYNRSTEEVDDATWSGRDHANRLIFCRYGRLYRREHGRDVEVADFNGLRPTPRPAPDWAMRPISGA